MEAAHEGGGGGGKSIAHAPGPHKSLGYALLVEMLVFIILYGVGVNGYADYATASRE